MSLANAIEPPPQLTFKDAWEKCPTVIWGVVKETHLVKETVKVWAAQEANLDFIVVDLIVLSSVKGDVKPGTVLKFYWGLDPTIFGNTTFGESPKVGVTMIVFSRADIDPKTAFKTAGYGLGVYYCDEKLWYQMKYESKGFPDGLLAGNGELRKKE